MITPKPYAHHTVRSSDGTAILLTNVLTGEAMTVSGTTIRVWRGDKGITVQGYDERTGRNTGTIKHLPVDTTKFVGMVWRGEVQRGESWCLGYKTMAEVFGQNV